MESDAGVAAVGVFQTGPSGGAFQGGGGGLKELPALEPVVAGGNAPGFVGPDVKREFFPARGGDEGVGEGFVQQADGVREGGVPDEGFNVRTTEFTAAGVQIAFGDQGGEVRGVQEFQGFGEARGPGELGDLIAQEGGGGVGQGGGVSQDFGGGEKPAESLETGSAAVGFGGVVVQREDEVRFGTGVSGDDPAVQGQSDGFFPAGAALEFGDAVLQDEGHEFQRRDGLALRVVARRNVNKSGTAGEGVDGFTTVKKL